MGIEIERKWAVRRLPTGLRDGRTLRQGYLASSPASSVRLRDQGDTLLLTVKKGAGLSRTEVEVEITSDQFAALWPLTAGARVEKTRFFLAVGDHTAELDRFSGALAGLLLVEVEFASEGDAQAFTPPDWFGDELTHTEGWTNAELALHGRPGGAPA